MGAIDKILCILVVLFLGVLTCVYYKNQCAPEWCNVCSFITGEYFFYREKLPNQ